MIKKNSGDFVKRKKNVEKKHDHLKEIKRKEERKK